MLLAPDQRPRLSKLVFTTTRRVGEMQRGIAGMLRINSTVRQCSDTLSNSVFLYTHTSEIFIRLNTITVTLHDTLRRRNHHFIDDKSSMYALSVGVDN